MSKDFRNYSNSGVLRIINKIDVLCVEISNSFFKSIILFIGILLFQFFILNFKPSSGFEQFVFVLIPTLFLILLNKNKKKYALSFHKSDLTNLLSILIQIMIVFCVYVCLFFIHSWKLIPNITFDEITNQKYIQDLISFVFFVFFAAFFEELLFRGLIFQELSNKFNKFIVTIGISALFAFAHLFNPNTNLIGILNVFLAGVLFSIMLFQSGSIYVPLLFHFLWNLFQALFLGSNISGNPIKLALFSFVQTSNNSKIDSILLSNEFGIEGSLYCTIILCVLIVYNLKFLKTSPYYSAEILKIKYGINS